MTLALNGKALEVRGTFASGTTEVIRLQSAESSERPTDNDYVLLKTSDENWRRNADKFQRCVVISPSANSFDISIPAAKALVVLPAAFNYLEAGDIVALSSTSAKVRTLFRSQSSHNSFLVTDRCNHYCLMCSQPPKNVNDRWILEEIGAALKLVHPSTESLGFTGGEPLLDWREFIGLLDQCKNQLPNTAIHVLSNGRAFSNNEVVNAWAALQHPDLMVGIPLYSAEDTIHNYVVQASGAFDETVLGVLKLKDRKQRVEIRIVLHAITAPHIRETCAWIARNLPFVDHVALMALENTGFAIANDNLLWIDPVDYGLGLSEAVEELTSAGLRVSIYNLQRCVLPKPLWPYAIRSISDWKNGFLPECDECIEKQNCAGFFTSGRPRRSRAISAIL